jgi:hypothetical protein
MRVITGLLTAIAAGGVLAGCAGEPAGQAEAGAPQPPSEQAQQARTKAEQDSARVQNLIADCMKAQGFTYVPHVLKYSDSAHDGNVGGHDPSQVPYETVKTYRQKYGFGIYGRDVYPRDPNVVGRAVDPDSNPNNAIREGLDPARRQAYDKALAGNSGELKAGQKPVTAEPGCAGKAAEQVYPAAPPDQAEQAEYQQLVRAFQTDPQLLQAGQAYGSCLRQAGFQVPSTKPGVIEMTVQQILLKERNELPDKIDAAAAQQGLQREIEKSLQDLECGKEYEKLAKPHIDKLLASGGGNG